VETALLCLLLFLAGIGGDYCWAKWTKASNNSQPYVAANWSFMIYVFSLAYTVSIVEAKWFAVGFYLVGSYIGTVLAVRQSK